MTRTCEHGTFLGAPCDDPTCWNRSDHYCTTLPCPTVGCEHSRPAQPLGEVIAQHARPREAQGYEGVRHTPEARELARRMDALARRDTATGDLTRGRGFIGVREDGRRNHGARPWHWCYGRQPVHVAGAVYEDTNEARHLVRGITEAEAQRLTLAAALAATSGAVVMSPCSIIREKLRRG